MKRISLTLVLTLLASVILTGCLLAADPIPGRKYYQWPTADLKDNSRILVFDSNSGSRNVTGAGLKLYALNGVNAAFVGLGNVTNESKATMFTNPTFTGSLHAGDTHLIAVNYGANPAMDYTNKYLDNSDEDTFKIGVRKYVNGFQQGGGEVYIGPDLLSLSHDEIDLYATAIKLYGTVEKVTASDYALAALNAAPASASSVCTTGQIAWTAGHIYLCTATNTWKRAALTTW